MTVEEAEVLAIEHGIEKHDQGILFCPITTYKVEDGWICEAYYDGGNHYLSVFSNEQNEAVRYAKSWLEEMFSHSYRSFEYEETAVQAGELPFCKNSDCADVKIIFRQDKE